MKALIAYATKSGAARECAELLATRLPNAELCDLYAGSPDISEFDTIIIGSGVRMGRIYKPLRKFMQDNLGALTAKRLAIYLCNGSAEAFPEIVDKNIAPELAASAICVLSFGGRMPTKEGRSSEWMLTENIESLITCVTA